VGKISLTTVSRRECPFEGDYLKGGDVGGGKYDLDKTRGRSGEKGPGKKSKNSIHRSLYIREIDRPVEKSIKEGESKDKVRKFRTKFAKQNCAQETTR